MPEAILIVDDEEPVRRTFAEWLAGSGLDCTIHQAADAEQALRIVHERPIDLAVLDWNLGAGSNGLELLEDLAVFNPNIAAILVTGYAHQATPLAAMRMGVRDYLDKNQDLNRDSFLAVVRKQLELLRPAKRERAVHQSLAAFRDAVQNVLPLVQTSTALNDPAPLTDSLRGLLQFLLRVTGAGNCALVVRRHAPERSPPETVQVFDALGQPLAAELVPFSQSLASAAASFQGGSVLAADLAQMGARQGVVLQPFEAAHRHLLAAPVDVGPGLTVVIELFDRRGTNGQPVPFTPEDRQFLAAAAGFAADLLRHALGEKQARDLLLAAVEAALRASQDALQAGSAADRPVEDVALDQLRQTLRDSPLVVLDSPETLRLAEKLRSLVVRHGPESARFCERMLDELRGLLDASPGKS